MLGPSDFQLTAKAFEDAAEEAEYWHGALKPSNRPITCKVSPCSETNNQWIGESQAYCDLQCPALITPLGYAVYSNERGQFLLLFTEPINTSIAADIAIRRTQNSKYELTEVVQIIRQCIEGLKAIWGANKASRGHGNLTPSSIFKTMDGNIKIGNFNSVLANRRPRNGFYSSYVHPNVLAGKEMQPWQADLFDLGVLLYHLCTLEDPQRLNDLSEFRIPAKYKSLINSADMKYQKEALAALFSELMQVNTNKTASQAIEQIDKLCTALEAGSSRIGHSVSSGGMRGQNQTAPQAPVQEVTQPINQRYEAKSGSEAAWQGASAYSAASSSAAYQMISQVHSQPAENPPPEAAWQDASAYPAANSSAAYQMDSQSPPQPVENSLFSQYQGYPMQGSSHDEARNSSFAGKGSHEFPSRDTGSSLSYSANPQLVQPLQNYQQDAYGLQEYGMDQTATGNQLQPSQEQPMQLDSKACSSCSATNQLRAGAFAFVCAECFTLNRL